MRQVKPCWPTEMAGREAAGIAIYTRQLPGRPARLYLCRAVIARRILFPGLQNYPEPLPRSALYLAGRDQDHGEACRTRRGGLAPGASDRVPGRPYVPRFAPRTVPMGRR